MLKQPGTTSWAAAAAIMLGWKEHRHYDPIDALIKADHVRSSKPNIFTSYTFVDVFNQGRALPSVDEMQLGAMLDMKEDLPQDYTAASLSALMKSHGPVWIQPYDIKDGRSFTQVLFGISGDNTTKGTMVSFVDPSTGEQKAESLQVLNNTYGKHGSIPAAIHHY